MKQIAKTTKLQNYKTPKFKNDPPLGF